MEDLYQLFISIYYIAITLALEYVENQQVLAFSLASPYLKLKPVNLT